MKMTNIKWNEQSLRYNTEGFVENKQKQRYIRNRCQKAEMEMLKDRVQRSVHIPFVLLTTIQKKERLYIESLV